MVWADSRSVGDRNSDLITDPSLFSSALDYTSSPQVISPLWCGRAPRSWASERPQLLTAPPLWWPDTSPPGTLLTKDTLKTTCCQRKPPHEVKRSRGGHTSKDPEGILFFGCFDLIHSGDCCPPAMQWRKLRMAAFLA